MSNLPTAEIAALTELFRLLVGNDINETEIQEALDRIFRAPSDPDYQWFLDLHDDNPNATIGFALIDCLETLELMVFSDKIDELDDQISDLFENPLPEFPTWYDKSRYLPNDYFAWLDRELSQRGVVENGGYELLQFDAGLDDNIHAIVVNRADTPRILDLGQSLNAAIDTRISRLHNVDVTVLTDRRS